MANLLALITEHLQAYLWLVTILLLAMLAWTWIQLRTCRRESGDTARLHAEHIARLNPLREADWSRRGMSEENKRRMDAMLTMLHPPVRLRQSAARRERKD